MKVVLSRLSDMFLLREYFSLKDDVEIEEEIMKFYIDVSYIGLRDKTIGTLIALIASGQAKIIFVDGYHENIFYRCQIIFGNMLRSVLGEGLTKSLLTSSIIYRRIDTQLDFQNVMIDLKKNMDENKDVLIDLTKEETWTDYIKNRYPTLYKTKFTDPEDEQTVLN